MWMVMDLYTQPIFKFHIPFDLTELVQLMPL